MSLGGLTYWKQVFPYVPPSQIIVESGVAIVAALGSDGQLGPYAVSDPGLAPEVLAVGSAESEIHSTVYKAENKLGKMLEYISVLPFISGQPMTIFKTSTILDIPITEEQTGGCDPSVWTAAQSIIMDGTHTLIYNTVYCSLKVYSDQLLTMNVTNVIYFTDDPDTPILLEEPGTVDPFNFLFLGYSQLQQINKDISNVLGKNTRWTLSLPWSKTCPT